MLAGNILHCGHIYFRWLNMNSSAVLFTHAKSESQTLFTSIAAPAPLWPKKWKCEKEKYRSTQMMLFAIAIAYTIDYSLFLVRKPLARWLKQCLLGLIRFVCHVSMSALVSQAKVQKIAIPNKGKMLEKYTRYHLEAKEKQTRKRKEKRHGEDWNCTKSEKEVIEKNEYKTISKFSFFHIFCSQFFSH